MKQQTGVYQHNYYDALKLHGREVSVSDGYVTYCYPIIGQDTLEDVLDSFGDSYDFDGLDDPPMGSGIEVQAEEYRDGVFIDRLIRVISQEVE